ncbi:hypothetical protein LX15_004365 [Streptoalloteichus tenebrarius]|uniref:Uncharacterized protein n=1 Tax=Streptoalloteichus tenebrarius (strain ATCC 17920 / DSM 40477 / JCM 4838 / CBS 697.72 / NBRC 16177 / NCIMB 11028 / NRRL B-12390 / A12253. 1 / ISP 5477) TaxID=1933 RepID=A0ABT1HYP3_STRSD|nr:hypothetical protein [Streptoalloteichus tenebrarius]MCP2260646.1 hypothetical protein [Streptoalloteichus tenebrarius]BFF01530.1 hypothetical protein GCM10020241_32050 [Streptoalloteichus tenebrarius]
MVTNIEYTEETHFNGGLCTVRVHGRGDSAEPRLDIEVFTADTEGELTGEGHLLLPVGALAAAGHLVQRVLVGLAQLHGATAGRGRFRASRPGNAFRPWSEEMDEELRTAWLGEPAGAPASEVTGRLAERMGRSRIAIRSRLARLGCDPDVPGRELPPAPGEDPSGPRDGERRPGRARHAPGTSLPP